MDAEQLRVATDLMIHRGPDESGIYCDGPVGFGHRRLSIIALTEGQQPMANEDRSVVLTFNGEIYNHGEIREELQARNRQLKSRSDTEVILRAYEEWGVECVNRFNGMFAFAIWDARKQWLWIVRDRFGIKPLYYYQTAEQLVCASEVKPVLHAAGVKAEINEAMLDSFFSLGYVPGPETMFKGIRKLEPGHYLLLRDGRCDKVNYWDFAALEPVDMAFAEARDRVESLFKDAVAKCLVADVPLGVFLSGGVDSSAIVAMMSELRVNPIDTFTIDYANSPEASEVTHAQVVADLFHTRHHVVRLEPESFLDSIRTLVRHCEEPVVEAASIALYHLSKYARSQVKAVLCGEGSDEVFAGYSIYNTMQGIERLQQKLPPAFWKRIAPLGSGLLDSKSKKYLDWLGLPLVQRFQGTSGYVTESFRNELYAPGFLDRRGDYLERIFAAHFNKVAHHRHALTKMQYVDFKTWLADDLLTKADKMSKAVSLELRVPFLDHRIVELGASLPVDFKCHGGEGKHILKVMLESRLPKEILYRKKMGFPVPVKQWFRGALLPAVKERLLEAGNLPWIRRQGIEKLIAEHESSTRDHSKFLLSLMVLSMWLDEYIHQPASPASPSRLATV